MHNFPMFEANGHAHFRVLLLLEGEKESNRLSIVLREGCVTFLEAIGTKIMHCVRREQ